MVHSRRVTVARARPRASSSRAKVPMSARRVSQEQAGRQAAEANMDMIITTTFEQMLAKTDAAVADQHPRQARITQRWDRA